MSLDVYKLFAGLLILLVSLLATIYPLRIQARPSHRPSLELGDAFASGIFLGAALFHMLPDAIYEFLQVSGNIHYPLAELFCACGFLLLLFFERLSVKTTSYVFAIIIVVHSLIEGAALGINTTLATAFIIFLAIIIHKGSESFALAVVLNRSGLTRFHILSIVVLFSFMTPLGIFIGTTTTLFLENNQKLLLTAGFNAFAAGTFLYMSTLHHINHHQRSHAGEGLIEFVALVFGLAIMACLAWWS